MSAASGAIDRLRVFFALVPDRPTRARLGERARALAAQADGRAIADTNLHLTLAFIGDVARGDADRLASLCAEQRGAAFPLVLDRVGAFRNGEIAWVAPTDVPPPLSRLQRELIAALTAARFPVDARRFHAHVTLARRCRRTVPEARCEPIEWVVDALSLMQSEAAADGVRYRVLAQAKLAP